MTIDIKDIKQGMPGLSQGSGMHLFEGCVVCLTRHQHSNNGTEFSVYGDKDIQYTLAWEDIFDEQLDRTWKDQIYATEHGAVCLAILLALKLTDYTIIEKSVRKTGFDYWLGHPGDLLFQRKARLEISGIFKDSISEVDRRYRVKVKQTKISDATGLPAYVGIVEFGKPIAKFGIRK